MLQNSKLSIKIFKWTFGLHLPCKVLWVSGQRIRLLLRTIRLDLQSLRLDLYWHTYFRVWVKLNTFLSYATHQHLPSLKSESWSWKSRVYLLFCTSSIFVIQRCRLLRNMCEFYFFLEFYAIKLMGTWNKISFCFNRSFQYYAN